MRTLDIIVADKMYHLDLASLNGRPLQLCIDGEPLEVSIRNVPEQKVWPDQPGLPQAFPAPAKPCAAKPVMADIHFNHYPE